MADLSCRVADCVDDPLVEAAERLLPQLTGRPAEDPRPALEAVVASPTASLLVAIDAGAIVGIATLALTMAPTGCRARLEDVVVDEAVRGRGTAAALVSAAVALAWRAGAAHVELTSHPSREAANRLYRRLGFAPRETNVLRLDRPDAP